MDLFLGIDIPDLGTIDSFYKVFSGQVSADTLFASFIEGLKSFFQTFFASFTA